MIPREVDELMWTIAEGGDPHAISEFGDRYPNLREELLKRIRTVQALKSSGRSSKTGAVPIFRNPQTQPVNWRLIFATFAVTVLAVFSFGIWRMSAHTPPAVNVPAVNTEPTRMPDVNLPTQTNVPNSQTNNGQPPSAAPVNPPVVPNPTNTEPGKTTVQLESAPLHAAILLIAEAGRLQVTIANGLPNPTVRIDYKDMTPMEMLKRLGNEYAFDTLMDGDHAIIVIPKKDEDEDQMTNESH